ncbi:MAG: hypothetical protein P8X57_02350 [Cyclobacteriaceae bacterium]
MKRHESLVPLSRFHRKVLFLALIARENAPNVNGYPTVPEQKIDFAVAFYNQQLLDHFSVEEKLWNYFAGKYQSLRSLIDELREERRQLHTLFLELEKEKSQSQLFLLGPQLERHVRRQERELFQGIQQTASADDYEFIQSQVASG